MICNAMLTVMKFDKILKIFSSENNVISKTINKLRICITDKHKVLERMFSDFRK